MRWYTSPIYMVLLCQNIAPGVKALISVHQPGRRSLCATPNVAHCRHISLTHRKGSNPLSSLKEHQNNDDLPARKYVRYAFNKFKSRPGTYLLIPCVAALVGWFTNWLAVQMIFYPINFIGLPLWRIPEVPLGLIGWQGIIPCKTRQMSEAMVDMVTSQLLSVSDAFSRLDPKQMAKLLAPEVPKIGQEVLNEAIGAQQWLSRFPLAIFTGFDGVSKRVLQHLNFRFLVDLTKSLQLNIDDVFNLKNCVVNQMMADRSKLGQLFRKCGQKELVFLTNSGLWFGFLLGCIQMIVALFWDNPWSLSIGGGIVGLATNWLALKWIFEPVNPVRVFNLFTLQGMFLRRQKEVATEFSEYFAQNVLTAENMWASVLSDSQTRPTFNALFSRHFQSLVRRVSAGLRIGLEPETVSAVTARALEKLPQHVSPTYAYMDRALGLQNTLRVRMEGMTSQQFERVLHPIFEEDELTLVLAGAALGFLAGLVQQGLETGSIRLPELRLRDRLLGVAQTAKKILQSSRNRLYKLLRG